MGEIAVLREASISKTVPLSSISAPKVDPLRDYTSYIEV
jgi:hypothetical protein